MRQTLFNYVVYPYGQSCLFMWLKKHPAYTGRSLSLAEAVESDCGEESSAVNVMKDINVTTYALESGLIFLSISWTSWMSLYEIYHTDNPGNWEIA